MGREAIDGQRRRGQVRVLALLLAAPLILVGCAKSAPGAEPVPLPTLAVATQLPSSSPSAAPTPSASPTPVDPFDTLSAKAKKEFKGCLTKTVGPGSGGKCAKLVVKKLKAAGFYPWGSTSVINVAGANALLNYQRSRGIKATATTTKATWRARRCP